MARSRIWLCVSATMVA